jgi:hypothetical protein
MFLVGLLPSGFFSVSSVSSVVEAVQKGPISR